MYIYIVKNERHEEVAAYTDPKKAEYLAERLQSATLMDYSIEVLLVYIEELVVDTEELVVD
jgi:hypothetical protein